MLADVELHLEQLRAELPEGRAQLVRDLSREGRRTRARTVKGRKRWRGARWQDAEGGDGRGQE